MHFIKQLCFLPHTKLIYQQLHLNLILQPGYSQPQFGHIEAWALELLANARKELCHVRLESLDGIIGMGAVSWFGKDLVGSMLCNWVLKVLFSIDGFMR